MFTAYIPQSDTFNQLVEHSTASSFLAGRVAIILEEIILLTKSLHFLTHCSSPLTPCERLTSLPVAGHEAFKQILPGSHGPRSST
jgi:hypothetical protein